MKLLIFGASGRTGKQLVAQALAAGHNVTAFVRNPASLQLTHPKLTLAVGNVLQPETVEAAMPGHDAVLCAIGNVGFNATDKLHELGTKNIIVAMKRHNVKRLVVETSWGLGESLATVNKVFYWLFMRWLLKDVMADKAKQEAEVQASSLDWVIVRPGGLTDKPARGGVVANTTGHGLAQQLSRADVASFMLSQVESNEYLHKAIVIGYRS
jgi:putative NADH-flavin reductase